MKSILKHIDFTILPVDLALFAYGLYLLFTDNSAFEITTYQGNESSVMLIIILTVVPWYTGYLIFHFEKYPAFIRGIAKWLFGAGILSLIIFLIITFVGELAQVENPSGVTYFLSVFGMFFTVLGPMMIIAGYVDNKFLDESDDPSKDIQWPMVTWVMFMVILAIVFLILTVGIFNPDPDGWGALGVVFLGFIGGTILAMAVVGGIGYVLKEFGEQDKKRYMIKAFKFLFPLIVINCLIWWNDIALGKILEWNDYAPLSTSNIIWSMTLCGILPFRILMLLKPPVDWHNVIAGIVALSIYVIGLSNSFQ